MRPHIRAFLDLCAEMLPCPEPIAEIGAKIVPGQEHIADLRSLFSGRNFIGCDMEPGPGVDRIEDLHALKFNDNEVGTFLLSDTLEHVRDPFLAVEELKRSLNHEKGLMIATSVMNFPIHAHPNDYWRFTPEAFRSLAAGFDFAAVFYAGDPLNPHSVCLIAGFGKALAARVRKLAGPAKKLAVSAPPHLDQLSKELINHLARRLIAEHPDPPPESQPARGALEVPFKQRGWILLPGAWVRGWTALAGTRSLEIRVQGTTIHKVSLDVPRPELDTALGLPPGTARGFINQVQFLTDKEIAGQAELWAVGSKDDVIVAPPSPPGIVLPRSILEPGLILHSFDMDKSPGRRVVKTPDSDRVVLTGEKAMADNPRRNLVSKFLPRRRKKGPSIRGRRLVAAIRRQGDPVRVDLGCGFRKQGNIGIDRIQKGTDADLVCELGFEPIPLDDESVDEVICRDFLEHVPKAVYLENSQKMHYPIIHLMNEIWRILKPGGTFTSRTPCYPKEEVHQDPTHLSVWTENSMDYFCGKYPIAKTYGVKASFELVEKGIEDFYLCAVLRKGTGTVTGP